MNPEEQIKFLNQACENAVKAVERGNNPFGAVIVNNEGEVIASSHNLIYENCDPTAHGQIVTIRAACAKIKSTDLSGCTIYSSSQPCPMCLAACYWSKISKIYYACTVEEAEEIKFEDKFFYEELKKENHERTLPMINNKNVEGRLIAFQKYAAKLFTSKEEQ